MSTSHSRSRTSQQQRQLRRKRRLFFTEALESRNLMAADINPWHNEFNPADVDSDQTFTPLDALIVINDLNANGARSLLASSGGVGGTGAAGAEAESTSFKVDVDNDNYASPLDALKLVNLLNGEGETGPLVSLTLEARNLDGTPLPTVNGVSTVPVGTKFMVRMTGKDLRTLSPKGVAAAYLDVFYNQSDVKVDLRENQLITVNGSPDTGTFRLTLKNPNTGLSETTGDINFDSADPITTRTNILNALVGLNMVLPGEVVVESPPKQLSSLDESFNFVVRFGGKFANTNVDEMTATSTMAVSVSQLSGTTPGDATDFLRSISYQPRYRDVILGNDGDGVNTNVVDEVGASDFQVSNGVPRQVFDFEVTAIGPGLATFTGDPSDTNSAAVLLHSINAAIPADQITFVNASVNIVQPITTVDDTASVNEDVTTGVTIDVMANDTLNQGGSKQLIGTYPQSVTGGTVSLDTRGTASNKADDRLIFTPSANFFGTSTFQYTIGDGQGNTAVANVTVTVNPVNDAPVNTVPAAQTMNEDGVIGFNGSNIFSLTDIDAGTQPMTVTFTATNGVLTLTNPNPTGVTVTGNISANIHLTGSQVDLRAAVDGLIFRPTLDFPTTGTSGTATIVMTTSDQGNTGLNDLPVLTDSDTVTVTVRAVNDAPVNTVPGGQSTIEGTAIAFSGANKIQVSDVDAGTGSLRTVISLTPNNSGTLTVTNAAAGAAITGSPGLAVTITGTVKAINDTLANSLIYTPRTDANPLLNFIGQATITVTTSDQGNTGFAGNNPVLTDTDTIVVDVKPAVRPLAISDSFTVVEDSTSATPANSFDVLANDVAHTDATFNLKSFTQPAIGSVTQSGNKLVFTPLPFFNGSTSFTYVINDSLEGTVDGGADSTGTVSITVQEVNDAPFANDDIGATTEDLALTMTTTFLTSNDSKGPANESGQTLTVSLPSGTTKLGGTVTLAGGQVTYTPPKDINDANGGPDTFVYRITDNGTTQGSPNPLSADGTMSIQLITVNDAPVTSNDTATTAEDTAVTITASSLTGNDKPGPATATDEVGQTLTLKSVSGTSANGGTVALVNGEVIYTPASNFNGTDTFTYVVEDNGMSNIPLTPDPKTATGTVTVTVTEVNDAPVANDDNVIAIKNGGAITYTPSMLLANDKPGPANENGQTLSVIDVSVASHGSVVRLSNGSIVYTPDAGYEGNDSFAYQIKDNGTTDGNPAPKTAIATVNVSVLNFVPMTISGYVYNDLNNDGVRDGNETPLSGVDVTLTGFNSVTNVAITPQVVTTDRFGFYQFTGLAPGDYFIQEAQPANMVDGRESVTGPLTVSANDQLRFVVSLQDNINTPQHVFSENNFGERSLSSSFLALNYLLASSMMVGGRAEYLQGILFGFSDTAGQVVDWYSFRQGWDGYDLSSFTLAADRLSAVLRVTNAANQIFQTTIGLDTGRLKLRQDTVGHTTAYVQGSFNDFNWSQVAQGNGERAEGEAPEEADTAAMLAAVLGGSGNYANAVDAALADMIG